MRATTKRILQKGNFRGLEDRTESMKLVRGIVRDLYIGGKRKEKLAPVELRNLAKVLTTCWWCSFWAIALLMKCPGEPLDKLRKVVKRSTPLREEYEDLVDKLIAQHELLTSGKGFDRSLYQKP